MNNLKCLKQGFNKYVCKHTNKEIKLSDCKNCPYKEYKSNNSQIKRTTKNKHKEALNTVKFRKKSSKLAKLEENRFSLFTGNMDKCYFCNKPKDHIHEVIYGKNRSNSMKYGITLPLCEEHHRMMHNDITLTKEYRKKGQALFQETYPDLDFQEIFKINYL